MKLLNYSVQEEPIGCGGMGNVYLAYDSGQRKVAIKEMRSEFLTDSNLRKRFLEEIRLMNEFDHPSIVKMLSSFSENGNMYLVMEYIDGDTLEKHVRVKGRLEEKEAVPILLKVLDALQYAHNKGIVHRDVKPSNIMIRGDGRICLLDFGIAKDLKGIGLTVGEFSIGTSGYMSPEQAEGLTINHLSDIYSLGCVLFYMLTGQHAITKQSNDHATRMSIITNEFPNAKLLNPSLSDLIISVLERATNKNMMKRFRSCAEFEKSLTSMSGTIQESKTDICSISIGRGDYDIKIYDPNNRVSTHHADIERIKTDSGFQFVYIDRSTNGSVINGEKIHHQRKIISSGMKNSGKGSSPWPPVILLACSSDYSLNWSSVEKAFNEKYGSVSVVNNRVPSEEIDQSIVRSNMDHDLSVGWIVLALIFPIVGWVMYYQWKDISYYKARRISTLSWVGFIISFVINLLVRIV